MNQYRAYLRAELGKLSHRNDADCFVQKLPVALLEDCGLSTSAGEISSSTATQEAVDAFVAKLPDETARRLTEACSKLWRENDVFDKLQTSNTWREARVPVELIELQQAEKGELGCLFRENGNSLRRIATDERILASEPYCHHQPGEPVQHPMCLAIKRGETYRIFDGMHRAIQLVRNGEATICLCYAQQP